MLGLARPGRKSRGDSTAEETEGNRHHHGQRPTLSPKVAVENIAEPSTAEPAQWDVDNGPSRAPIDRLDDRNGRNPGQGCQREPQMIAMEGKPGPALVEPRLDSMAVHPMLANEIAERELGVRRYLHANQRPARPDRDQRRENRDLLNDRFWAAPA